MSNRIRSSLAKLERELSVTGDDDAPPPTPRQAAYNARFSEAFQQLTDHQKDWVRYAAHGFTKPARYGNYVVSGAWDDFGPPWAYDPPPPVPDWLPAILARLGMPTVEELRAMGERGELTRERSH